MTTYYGVYRVLKSGEHSYLARSATANEKLAQEIARDRTNGVAIRPDGSTLHIPAFPHIVKPIGTVED